MIGLDIHLAKTNMLYKKTGDARYRPCYLIEPMVQAGMLGRKPAVAFTIILNQKRFPASFLGNKEG